MLKDFTDEGIRASILACAIRDAEKVDKAYPKPDQYFERALMMGSLADAASPNVLGLALDGQLVFLDPKGKAATEFGTVQAYLSQWVVELCVDVMPVCVVPRRQYVQQAVVEAGLASVVLNQDKTIEDLENELKSMVDMGNKGT
jgi:hypothetical protein